MPFILSPESIDQGMQDQGTIDTNCPPAWKEKFLEDRNDNCSSNFSSEEIGLQAE